MLLSILQNRGIKCQWDHPNSKRYYQIELSTRNRGSELLTQMTDERLYKLIPYHNTG
jgi:hypothetical protein